MSHLPEQATSDPEWLASFEDMFRRLRPALLKFFRRRVQSNTVAEELVQELFLRLLRRPDLFALDNLDGYVFEAAANLVRDGARRGAVRGQGQHVDLDTIQIMSDEPSADRVLEGRQRVEELMLALKELPPRTRTVLILSRFEGFTYAQIARRLGISVSAVEKHMVKALAGLRVRG